MVGHGMELVVFLFLFFYSLLFFRFHSPYAKVLFTTILNALYHLLLIIFSSALLFISFTLLFFVCFYHHGYELTYTTHTC